MEWEAVGWDGLMGGEEGDSGWGDFKNQQDWNTRPVRPRRHQPQKKSNVLNFLRAFS